MEGNDIQNFLVFQMTENGLVRLKESNSNSSGDDTPITKRNKRKVKFSEPEVTSEQEEGGKITFYSPGKAEFEEFGAHFNPSVFSPDDADPSNKRIDTQQSPETFDSQDIILTPQTGSFNVGESQVVRLPFEFENMDHSPITDLRPPVTPEFEQEDTIVKSTESTFPEPETPDFKVSPITDLRSPKPKSPVTEKPNLFAEETLSPSSEQNPETKPNLFAKEKLSPNSPFSPSKEEEIEDKAIEAELKLPLTLKQLEKNDDIGFSKQILSLDQWAAFISQSQDLKWCDPKTWKDNNLVYRSAKEHTGVSNTLQMTNNQVYGKISWTRPYEMRRKDGQIKSNSNFVEAAFYSCVVPVLFKSHSPFFVEFYSYHRCPVGSFNQITTLFGTQEFGNKVQSEINSQSSKPYVLFTKVAKDSRLLHDVLFSKTATNQRMPIPNRKLKNLIIQMVWHFLTFGAIDARHNDFHTRNILVTENTDLYYLKVEDDLFIKISDPEKVKVFDWDFASMYKTIYNNNESIFGDRNDVGICNQKSNAFDAIRMFTYLLVALPGSLSSSELLEFEGMFANFNKLIDESFGGIHIPFNTLATNTFTRGQFYPPTLEILAQQSQFQTKDLEKYAFKEHGNNLLPWNIDWIQFIKMNKDYFNDFLINKTQVPSDAFIYTIPTDKTKSTIMTLVEKYFPEVKPI